jgi:hypothetical protein
MEKNRTVNPIKNPNFLKEDIFLDYLNYNNNPLTNEEFVKPKFETFNKFFNNEENTPKSNKSSNKSLPHIAALEQCPINNTNNCNEKKKVNGGQEINLTEENYKNSNNNNNNISSFQNLDESSSTKKQLFNIKQHENLREKKLIMNRESAKKSRLKKKKYIENLEKEFILLKDELMRIKSNQNININNNKINAEELCSTKIFENINNDREKEIFDIKKEELNIITNNLEKNSNSVNNYVKKQKKILSYLLVKQIDVMTPIKIKAFQNKFLKLETFDRDDSIEVVKNKINTNLNTIMELYDIAPNDNNIEKNKTENPYSNKKNSMAFNLYDFYNSLKIYVYHYEYIYNKLEKI